MEDLDRLLAERDLDRRQLAGLAVGFLARRGDEEVEQDVLAAGRVDQHEAAGAGPRQGRLADERHEHRGDRGVDRVAAGAQRVGSGLGRQRVPGGDDASHAAQP